MLRFAMMLSVGASSLGGPAVAEPAAAGPGRAAASEAGAAAADASAARLTYPATARTDVADEQFGVRVADPYRWLEGDVRTTPDVAAWVAAQNRVTGAYLASLPGRDALAARMAELYRYDRLGIPQKRGSRLFFTRNNGQQNQSVLMVADGAGAANGRVLIDPNAWATDGATALAEWEASDDGSKLIYTVQDGGTDWRILRVMDVATGEQLSDELRWIKFSGLAWAPDGQGFWYSRFPAPEEGATFQSTNTNQAVYFHRLGTPQSEDRLVYATPDQPSYGHSAQLSDDGRWLVITTTQGTDDRYEMSVLDLQRPQAGVRPIVAGLEHKWELVGNEGSRLIFLTDKDAPRGRIVALDAVRRIGPVELVPEREATLQRARRVGDRIILSYLGDASSSAEMVDLNGRPVGRLTLGEIGTASGFDGSANSSETYYAFTSFNRPTTIYRLDTATGATEVFARPEVGFDPDDYSVEQRFYLSRDGTRVPMFVVMKRGLDRSGGSPTILYGYGGFALPQTPAFSPTRLAWLDAGGVYAVANLRGGSEYGAAWHDAGRLANKQNVFDDFIAAGEYLIREGITGEGQLAIEGRSNGGLLVGAVVNQRPDLFAAALPGVGVMDMLRFDRFTAGRYWVDDYGYPNREADFRTLYSYSPYHNIRAGQRYPAILVTTADTDDRVVPGHSFKYAAALQAADLGDRPHLIRIETRAGHGSGKPVDKIVAEFADQYAFAARWTGLDLAAGLDRAAAPATSTTGE